MSSGSITSKRQGALGDACEPLRLIFWMTWRPQNHLCACRRAVPTRVSSLQPLLALLGAHLAPPAERMTAGRGRSSTLSLSWALVLSMAILSLFRCVACRPSILPCLVSQTVLSCTALAATRGASWLKLSDAFCRLCQHRAQLLEQCRQRPWTALRASPTSQRAPPSMMPRCRSSPSPA